jgi:hypothetical protein
MSITATTLSAAISNSDVVLGVASASGISAPVQTTGSGFTFLKVDDEVMFVTGVSGTQIKVLRGQLGTPAQPHAASVPVLIGAPSDYPAFAPITTFTQPSKPDNSMPIGPPLTGATIAPSGGFVHHFTGTTALSTITPPAGLISGGKITLIFDGSGSGLTWDASDNIAVAGTSTTAGSAVDFFYDPSSGKWHPSRLA